MPTQELLLKEPLNQGLYSSINHQGLGGFLHLTLETTYTYTKCQLIQELLLNKPLKQGLYSSIKCQSLGGLLHLTHTTLIHIFELPYKDITHINTTILNNLDSRMPTTSWVSGRLEGSHMAFLRW